MTPGSGKAATSVQDFLGTTPARPKTTGTPWATGALSLYATGPQPFTPAWYREHPNAWKVTHPNADTWAAATAVGLATWLAVASVPVSGPVVVGEPASVGTSEAAVEDQSSAAEEAEALVQAGAASVADDTQWMQIGVFGLSPQGVPQATRMVQLAISREGVLRGVHHDLISEQTESLHGKVDKQTLRAAWSVGEKSQVVFEAPLGDLTRPTTPVTLHFPNGQYASWQLTQSAQSGDAGTQ